MIEKDMVLPRTDVKEVGAADFYFAINATFRFILNRLGVDGLRRYWTDIGTPYYQPVTESWRLGGFTAVSAYWRAFFEAEPDARVVVSTTDDEVRVEVKTCPAIKHLRDHGREIVSCFCQQCYFVSEAMAGPAGLSVRVTGGNGTCMQRFLKRDAALTPQRLEDIAEAS